MVDVDVFIQKFYSCVFIDFICMFELLLRENMVGYEVDFVLR